MAQVLIGADEPDPDAAANLDAKAKSKLQAKANEVFGASPSGLRYRGDLRLKDEAHLRTVLADLLGKAGAKGVRITHGHNERGKDIIFYKPGGLSKVQTRRAVEGRIVRLPG